MKHLGLFMNKTFSGRLTEEKIKPLRDKWKGNLVIKGIVNEEDADKAIALGVDGMIVSNHGGRQLDSGESTIKPLHRLAKKYKGKTTLLMDGGIRSGVDIASTIASGADFTFLGRAPMFGACAMGKKVVIRSWKSSNAKYNKLWNRSAVKKYQIFHHTSSRTR